MSRETAPHRRPSAQGGATTLSATDPCAPSWIASGMDVMEAIYERRSVRAYTERKVERERVLALIDAAIQAPSAMNQQPWSFAVIQDVALLARISERSKQLTLAGLKPGDALSDHRGMLQDPAFDIFYGGTTVVVVCARPGLWPANEDCCLAAQNLMLAAHALGLGSCPIGFARAALDEPGMKAELCVPADQSVVMPILLGYARERPSRPPRDAARILSWN